MGLFDLFKKKQPATTFPENELEKVLQRAAKDINAREEFYTRLLWNELFVITDGNRGEGTTTLEEGTTVNFLTFPDGVLPVFTSANRILDGNDKTPRSYNAMKGQDLLSLTRGSHLVLNPFSPFGKELPPHEIESILDGSIFNQLNGEPRQQVVEQDTEVFLGQPEQRPEEMLQALSDIFAVEPGVRAAYMALMHRSDEEHAHLLIGIDADDMRSAISSDKIGAVVEKFTSEKMPFVDFMQVSNCGVSDYLRNETEPFYTKQ